MDSQKRPPTREQIDAWRDMALGYLREQFGPSAPVTLSEPTVFPLSPLEGEGATAVFGFSAARGGGDEKPYYVVTGETEPNYYANEQLSPEEAFELHLGTRFMLVMGVAQAQAEAYIAKTGYDMRRDAEQIVRRVSLDASIDAVMLAAMFDVDGKMHAVLRCQVSGTSVYIMGADAPAGFSTRVDLPPHMAYRLHIGHVLRLEASPERQPPAP